MAKTPNASLHTKTPCDAVELKSKFLSPLVSDCDSESKTDKEWQVNRYKFWHLN